DAASPGEEFKIAVAGPLATFCFVLLCFGLDLAIVGPQRLVHAAKLDDTVHITPVLLSLSWLLPMNILILFFNLVPAFPLEGGRVADIMDRHPVAIGAEVPVGQALEEFFLRYGWSWFPVIDAEGHFIGLARQERLQSAQDRGEGWLTVGGVVEAEDAVSWRV